VASHADGSGSEPWLNDHTDSGEVFVGGDSAGDNISHTLAFRVGSIGLPAVQVSWNYYDTSIFLVALKMMKCGCKCAQIIE
jgi:acetyl esterase/lipase